MPGRGCYNGGMLSVLSPAKSLDYESALPTRKFSEPLHLDDSAALVDIMAAKSPAQIGKLMSVSDKLAELNFERFQDWERPFTQDTARPALLAFDGDVYAGMDARGSFGERDFTRAQKSMRILSGLYGVLRPLDLMLPYRLEMGTRLPNDRGKDLYAFWRGTVTETLRDDIAASPGAKVLVNLASNEYFGAVEPSNLDAKVVSPVFLDSKAGGDYKIVAFFAKRARGAMAGWMVTDRVEKVSELAGFTGMGYRFDAERSEETRPVFIREHAA